MFGESICSSTGIANKSHGLCFCACSPCPRRYLTFTSAYPEQKRAWLYCARWAGGVPTHAVQWQLGGAWNGNASCCLSPGRALAVEGVLSFLLLCGFLFSRADSTDQFSEACYSWWGVFGVSPTILARFTALQVLDSMVCWDQRSSGGLRLYIYVVFYYLLLSVILSKITQTEKLRQNSCVRSVSYCACCTPGFFQDESVLPGAASLHQLLQVLLQWLCVSKVLSAGKESSQHSSHLLCWIVLFRKPTLLPIFLL